MPELTTARLVLRPPTETDLAEIAILLNDRAVSGMLARVPHPYRLKDAKGWFSTINRPGHDEAPIFAISHNGHVCGMIGIRDDAGEPTLGYWLGRPYWGRGLMSEAVGAAVAYYFQHSDEDALFCGAFEDNPASLRIQEKLGFEITGTELSDCLATGQPRREVKTRLLRRAFAAVTAGQPVETGARPLTAAVKRAT